MEAETKGNGYTWEEKIVQDHGRWRKVVNGLCFGRGERPKL